jgi:hypothetical protein
MIIQNPQCFQSADWLEALDHRSSSDRHCHIQTAPLEGGGAEDGRATSPQRRLIRDWWVGWLYKATKTYAQKTLWDFK